MSTILRITEADHRLITDHLLETTAERAVFLYARVDRTDAVTFNVEGYRIVPPEGYAYQGPYYVELTDDEWAYLIKSAWDQRAALVEMHSHPLAPDEVSFSPSDLAGFAEIVPHVRWRLQGEPYLAVVIGPRNFDALAWVENLHRPEPVEGMLIGDRLYRPTGVTFARLRECPQ